MVVGTDGAQARCCHRYRSVLGRLTREVLIVRLLATLLDAWCSAGNHQLLWDATALPSGTYLARLHGGFGSCATRLTLTR